MKRVYPLTIQSGMSQSESYILMLLEPESGIQIPIFIGGYEAQSILVAKETIKTRRPMTHELIAHIMDEYGLSVEQITIDRMIDGIFYATLHVSDGFSSKTFDCRSTDAITLALLGDKPIMISEEVIEETGVMIDNNTLKNDTAKSLEELEEQLRTYEENEEYERAAEIQEKINKIKENL